LWGWIPEVDNGLPETPTTKPIEPDVPTTKPTPPGQGGAWVPTDPDFGKPVRPCPPVGGKPHPPLWAWIPDRPEVEPPDTGGGTGKATITLYPTQANATAAGGSGSVNVTITAPGTWTAVSDQPWLTVVSPTGPQTADVQIIYQVAQNPTGVARVAYITVNNAKLTLNQTAT
jgi:hypothetical protein